MIEIVAANDGHEELRVKRILTELLEQHDCSRWYFAEPVVIDEDAHTPHSHPVVTLRTFFSVRTRIGVLSTFLHEQLHWFLSAREEQTRAAMADLRVAFPSVPAGREGGAARDEGSTYLHLLLNWLEHRALTEIVGEEQAVATTRAQVIYPWIYERVLSDRRAIGEIVQRHGLEVPPEPAATQRGDWIRSIAIVLDCEDPERLAEFWTRALGYLRRGGRGAYVMLSSVDARLPTILLQRVPEPKAGKNRVHFDVHVPDVEETAARLSSLGAKRLTDAVEEHGSNWVVMADPEGNEFCVCRG